MPFANGPDRGTRLTLSRQVNVFPVNARLVDADTSLFFVFVSSSRVDSLESGVESDPSGFNRSLLRISGSWTFATESLVSLSPTVV